MRFRFSLSTCSKDRDAGAFFRSLFDPEGVADGWGTLIGGTGMLNSCGGGSEITELAPIVGIYPSGGSLNERWETVGLWFRIEMGRIGMVELVSLVECGRTAMFSGSFALS